MPPEWAPTLTLEEGNVVGSMKIDEQVFASSSNPHKDDITWCFMDTSAGGEGLDGLDEEWGSGSD